MGYTDGWGGGGGGGRGREGEIALSGRSGQLTLVPHERSTWRSGVRSALCAANQLPGRGPTDVDDVPEPAHLLII